MSSTPYGIKFNTARSIDDVEDWLEDHCVGEWDLKIGGLVETPDGSMLKEFQVFFEMDEDRSRFKTGFSKG